MVTIVPDRSGLRYRQLLFGFFLAGAAALVLEVVWSRYLGLLLGSSSRAGAAVLALYMGGMAAGSFSAGRLMLLGSGRFSAYTLLQFGAAVYSVLTPLLYQQICVPLSLAAANASPLAGVSLKLAAACLLLLPPTMMIGASFPAFAHELNPGSEGRGRTAARLYLVNSLGAVVGTLAAGFFLIARFGLDFTASIGAGLLAVAGISGTIAGRSAAVPEGATPEAPEDSGNNGLILAVMAASGFASMAYEVAWMRLLSVVLGSSVYAFSLMLAAFITGIAGGAFYASRRPMERPQALRRLGAVQLCIGLCVALSVPWYDRLPEAFLFAARALGTNGTAFFAYQVVQFGVAAAAMALPAFFIGMTFPLAGAAASGADTAGVLGRVLGWNTAGNILGTVGAGFVLLPHLGLENTLRACAALNIAAWAAVQARTGGLPRAARAASLAFTTAAAAQLLAFPSWSIQRFLTQAFRPTVRKAAQTQRADNKEIVSHTDDSDVSVTVTRLDGHYSLWVNGKVDASTGEDMETQIMLGHLPLLLKPDADRVMVIGLGSGITCGSALAHPVKSVDVVEISRAVARAAGQWFSSYNRDALKDPRLSLHVMDAKTFIARRGQPYDVIISEPSNPWMRGVAALFSEEFFAACAARLAPAGVMAQWLQAYEIDDATFLTVLRTFMTAFPYTTLWKQGPDVILIGSRVPMTPDLAAAGARLRTPAVRGDLGRIGVSGLLTVLSGQLASPRVLARAAESGSVHGDFFPVLDYRAPRTLFSGDNVFKLLASLDERYISARASPLAAARLLEAAPATAADLEQLVASLSKNPLANVRLLTSAAGVLWEKAPASRQAAGAYAEFNTAQAAAAVAALSLSARREASAEALLKLSKAAIARWSAQGSYLSDLPALDCERILRWCVSRAPPGAEGDLRDVLAGFLYDEHRWREAALEFSTAEAGYLAAGRTEPARAAGLRAEKSAGLAAASR